MKQSQEEDDLCCSVEDDDDHVFDASGRRRRRSAPWPGRSGGRLGRLAARRPRGILLWPSSRARRPVAEVGEDVRPGHVREAR